MTLETLLNTSGSIIRLIEVETDDKSSKNSRKTDTKGKG